MMSGNSAPQTKHDVFVSFRGHDVREGFRSHLVAAFNRKKIICFVDDKLERGDEIWPSLVGAIEGSAISLIIFSKDYASSHWCLEELVTILECREKYGQIIIPVFYGVEPTDVRHQTGSYESALAEHGRKYNSHKVQSWRCALNKSADLSGFKSSDFQNHARLTEEIVNHVLMRLSEPSVNSTSVNTSGLIGIDKKIAHVKSLIRQETKGTRVIGIWGMGGIGKTTIAEEVFHRLKSEYEGCYFLANVREKSKKQEIKSLKERIYSTLLGEDVKIDTRNRLPGYILRRIGRKKVLIVFYDVNDSDHLEKLLGMGTLDYFGPGSRIIVTTRDKQVIIAHKAIEIYEVESLSSSEGFELFNLNAFNQTDLQMEYCELSTRVVNYAKGIPLVLKVLARLLRGKDKKVWKSLLDKLINMPNKHAYEAMRLSYDDLDRKEQQIFLDLACFFVRLDLNIGYLESLLKDSESDNSVVDELERLKDKALITFSVDNFVSMHDIIQEMAWEIVRRESSCSRVWDPNDTYEVLKNDKGIEAIRSIQIPLSKFTFRMQKLSPHIFAKMSKLQFLDFSGVYIQYMSKLQFQDFSEAYFQIMSKLQFLNFSNWDQDCFHLLAEGFTFSSTELRFLRWDYFPLESLPENFSTEKLIILNLQNSKIKKLWHGMKNMVNLKEINLSCSENLEELPNFSSAINLEVLNLGCCKRLTSVHPSIFSLEKLEELDLRCCTSLTKLAEFSLQTLPKLPSFLVHLYVENCTSLQTLLELPSSLKDLCAQNCTSLHTLLELPLSLSTLDLQNCTSLQTLPELPPSLSTLDLQKCTSLTSLQTLPELPPSLSTLDLQK